MSLILLPKKARETPLVLPFSVSFFKRLSLSLSANTHDSVIEISRIAGGLAHEIRNPLSTLLLNLQLLDEDLGEGLDESSNTLRRARLRIGTARNEAERLQRMLDEFLLLVSPVGLKPQVSDLIDVVGELVEFYRPEAQRYGIDIGVDVAGGPLLCRLDTQVFKQALLNLLINAQQAVSGAGIIALALSREEQWALLAVSDSGEGMEPAVAAKAMQAFYSTKPNGCGLGLSTTSRIVDAHGGNVKIASSSLGGACFEIRIPLVSEPQT